MKRKFTLIFVCIISLLSCKFKSGNDLTEAVRAQLLGTEWGPEYMKAGVFLKFNSDGSIDSRVNFEGAYKLEATYEIKNDGVIILSITREEEIYQKPHIIKFRLKEAEDSLKYGKCIESIEGGSYKQVYYALNSKRDDTKVLIIDNNRIKIDRREQ